MNRRDFLLTIEASVVTACFPAFAMATDSYEHFDENEQYGNSVELNHIPATDEERKMIIDTIVDNINLTVPPAYRKNVKINLVGPEEPFGDLFELSWKYTPQERKQ